MSYNTPTPEDKKATRRALTILAAWGVAVIGLTLWFHFAPQVQNWYGHKQWVAEHSERICYHNTRWNWSNLYYYSWVTCAE